MEMLRSYKRCVEISEDLYHPGQSISFESTLLIFILTMNCTNYITYLTKYPEADDKKAINIVAIGTT